MKDIAIFAAGCFWGVQYYFDQVPGVLETETGYTGGNVENPTYEQVCGHKTGHAEAVRIVFDPRKVSYEKLLRHFFRMHDPTQLNRQGPDIGDQYRSAIFYTDEAQKKTAQIIINELNEQKFKNKIVTTLEPAFAEASVDRPAGRWWPAEEYHQKYTQKTGMGACHTPYQPI
ncbi:peptide-methionine (S)-S-oxide reductase MsrA [Candidatus Saccharibacteria bacterium]|nr:peptide-methionine (S)-S-oxide reductase MsrA [Candidatus Saccharibacteria bacterium]